MFHRHTPQVNTERAARIIDVALLILMNVSSPGASYITFDRRHMDWAKVIIWSRFPVQLTVDSIEHLFIH